MIRLTNNGASTATQQNYTYEIVERVGRKYNVNGGVKPVVTKTWQVVNQQLVGGQMYAQVQAVVNVLYQPKCGCGGLRTESYVEMIEVSFAGATGASTIEVTDTNGVTEYAYVCNNNDSVAQGVRNVGVIAVNFTA